VVVLVAACGGSASYDASGSPNVAGASGSANVDFGGSSGADTSTAGTTGGSTGGSGAGGSGRAGAPSEAGASAAAGDSGTAGDASQVSPGCAGLDCLAGAELVYWPDREWQRTTEPPMSDELPEADDTPKLGSAWDVKFSADARQIVLTPSAGGDAVQGLRDTQHVDRAWFQLMLPTGGRFVVQGGALPFQAEYTRYGSGLPIVSSTRGTLKAP